MLDAYLLFFILLGTIGLFIWGYFRYDVVALICLVALAVLNIVPTDQIFLGFSNPAVITVATVMVITTAIGQTGLIEQLIRLFQPVMAFPALHIGLMCLIAAVLSAFMNNVGALSLMMPIAIQSAINAKLSPSLMLMPLSFATVLGGMTTKIGTPPNLLISAYKEQLTGTPFALFDFLPVGICVAIIGLLFISIIGWRFIPVRRKPAKNTAELYQIHDYISEVQIPEDSPMVDKTRNELEHLIEGDFSILGLIRGRKKRLVIPQNEELRAGDIIIIEASHDDLTKLISKGKLELVHGEVISPESLRGKDISTIEAVVTMGSRIASRSWQRMRVRSRWQLNLLAISRSGKPIKNRLNHVNLRAGDVVLIQGASEYLHENVVSLGLVPLAERSINVGFKRSTLIPLGLFLIGIFLASTQLLPVEVAFTSVVLAMVILNVLPIRRVYQSIDWSIVILLGSLIPLGTALKSTGGAQLISHAVLAFSGAGSPILMLALLLLVTMTLSDLMNNAATAVVMAPIAINIAQTLQINVEPFLMAVAIGSSCSFLTPISHQNNTIIMGPGGYKFFDYLWLGVPVELIVLFTALPALSYFWL